MRLVVLRPFFTYLHPLRHHQRRGTWRDEQCLPSKASGDDTSASHVIEACEGTHTSSWAGGQGGEGECMLPPHLTMPHDAAERGNVVTTSTLFGMQTE